MGQTTSKYFHIIKLVASILITNSTSEQATLAPIFCFCVNKSANGRTRFARRKFPLYAPPPASGRLRFYGKLAPLPKKSLGLFGSPTRLRYVLKCPRRPARAKERILRANAVRSSQVSPLCSAARKRASALLRETCSSSQKVFRTFWEPYAASLRFKMPSTSRSCERANIAGEHGSPLHWENVVVECIVANVDFKNRMCYDISTGLYLQSRIDERGVTVEKIRLWNDEASADGFGGHKKH